MIKTCQARGPRVQYSLIPPATMEQDGDAAKERGKESLAAAAPPPFPAAMSDLKEELENKEPRLKHPPVAEPPVIRRRHAAPSLEVFVDCPRPATNNNNNNNRNLLQRPSFRTRQRPQSLILLSPPFPVVDYPTSGDDGKPAAASVFSKEAAETFRTPEGIALQNKMTIPKSGQRLETSTSCFYQPQRRSMIFDSRSHRQIE